MDLEGRGKPDQPIATYLKSGMTSQNGSVLLRNSARWVPLAAPQGGFDQSDIWDIACSEVARTENDAIFDEF
jgi:hypothetical protein